MINPLYKNKNRNKYQVSWLPSDTTKNVKRFTIEAYNEQDAKQVGRDHVKALSGVLVKIVKLG